MLLEANTKAPAFTLTNAQHQPVSLENYSGTWVVLYFYPKDLTPGCTIEAREFQQSLAQIRDAGAEVLGVSKDPPAMHQKFVNECDLTFPLLSDETGTMVEDYGVWQEKSMYGKKYFGIARVTYLIDPTGTIRKVYSKVKPETHAAEVLADLRVLAQ